MDKKETQNSKSSSRRIQSNITRTETTIARTVSGIEDFKAEVRAAPLPKTYGAVVARTQAVTQIAQYSKANLQLAREAEERRNRHQQRPPFQPTSQLLSAAQSSDQMLRDARRVNQGVSLTSTKYYSSVKYPPTTDVRGQNAGAGRGYDPVARPAPSGQGARGTNQTRR
jgi:hypothetical protein